MNAGWNIPALGPSLVPRRFVRKRFWATLLILSCAICLSPLALSKLASLDQVLASAGAQRTRVFMYELEPQGSLMLPIEPNTDMLRVVVVGSSWNAPLNSDVNPLLLVVKATDASGRTRHEELALELPRTTGRFVPETPALHVSDPLTFNIDARDLSGGSVAVKLKSFPKGDSVLLRAYRRQTLGTADREAQVRTLSTAKRQALATRAWESTWLDLEEDQQLEIASLRWKKAPFFEESAREAKPLALMLYRFPAPVREAPWPLAGELDSSPTEHIAFVADPQTQVRIVSDPPTALEVMITQPDGTSRRLRQQHQVDFSVTEQGPWGVEVRTQTVSRVQVRSRLGAGIHWYSKVSAFRATPSTPFIVRGTHTPLWLRVAFRKPVAVSTEAPQPVAVDVTTTIGRRRDRRVFQTTLARAPSDRYEHATDEVPTERDAFYLQIPRAGEVRLAPREGALDFSVAELDPEAPAEELAVRPFTTPAPTTRLIGGEPWEGFVARRPSNLEAHAKSPPLTMLLAQRLEVVDRSRALPLQYTSRILGGPRRLINGRGFEWSGSHLYVGIGPGARVLPLRLYADQATEVEISLESLQRRGRAQSLGPFKYLTRPRQVTLAKGQELRTSFILGDDLAPGSYRVRFNKPPRDAVWVRALVAQQVESRWVAGEFDE
ncbi:MAG: hypothetical protein SFV15_00530 [Polyangiaceae bacterium]|nr:hypothetical protein [Polyangiaceae bacterium]